MSRYIDVEKIKYKHKSNTSNTGGNNSMNYVTEEGIDNIPTADVQEVIYCKNCKNHYKFGNGDVVCEEFGGYIKDNDFCSRGKRLSWTDND